VLDFVTVDDTAGSLFPLVEQVRRAIGWVYRNADKFGGDRDRLYLISHSSGSHLAGCAVTHDWSKDGLPRDILKGATLSSGMYDLKPVRLSKRSKYVKFTDVMEQELSAIRHLDKLVTPLNISYGTYETPEFQRQARDFAAAVKAAGKPVELLVGEAYNHFEMLETLANPYGLLGRAVLAQMGLTQS
jgi:arylformamidase